MQQRYLLFSPDWILFGVIFKEYRVLSEIHDTCIFCFSFSYIGGWLLVVLFRGSFFCFFVGLFFQAMQKQAAGVF